MRPSKLTMRGFITYKDEVSIDFEKLYKKKIFLISGDTGSGKTTIFDAINYALYGVSSRGIDNLRSDFLTEEDPYTYVNLDFVVGDRSYRIERIPRQRAKKTKKAQNISNSVALFDTTKEKKLLSEKAKDTDKQIKKIIGLDQKQFSKVMLLAQGEFQEFLKASSKDKATLLGDIFKTYEYKDFENRIKDYAKEAITKAEFIDTKLEDLLINNEDLKTLIDKDLILTHDFDEILARLRDKNKDLGESYKATKERLVEKEKNLVDLYEKLNKGKSLNESIKILEEIENDLARQRQKEASYKELRIELDLAQKASNIEIYENRLRSNTKDLEEEKTFLEKLKEDIKIKDLAFRKIKEAFENKKDLEKSLEATKDKGKDLRKQIIDFNNFKQSEKAYKDLEGQRDDYNKVLKEENDLNKAKEELIKERTLVDELIFSLRDKESILRENLDRSKNNLKDLKDLYQRVRDLNKLEADIKALSDSKKFLAKKEKLALKNLDQIQLNTYIDRLNESGICPVCGSYHEEKFPKYQIENYDIDDIRKNMADLTSRIEYKNDKAVEISQSLKEEFSLELLEEKIKKTSSDIEKYQENLRLLAKKIEEKKKARINLVEDIDKLSEKIEVKKQAINSLDQKLSRSKEIEATYLAQKDIFLDFDEERKNSEIEKLRDIYKKDRERLEEINKSYTKGLVEINNLSQNIANSQRQIENLEEKDRAYKGEFEEKLAQVFENYGLYKSAKENMARLSPRKDEIEGYFKNLERLLTRLDTYKDFRGKSPVDLIKIEEMIGSTQREKERLSEDIKEIYLGLSLYEKTISSVEDLEESFAANTREADDLARLSKVADGSYGKVAGREKIDFESFVLTYYFDKVLSYGNARLLTMTDNQFTMVRSSNNSDQRSKSGLDIEILDANTGKLRPVETLSGGESFLASLSLALGLSDEISASNGGIKMGTLFIDEGFGTLSKDYLVNVIKAIEKLSNENKLVGLISHVDELKDAIDAKILVSYDPSYGSKVEVLA